MIRKTLALILGLLFATACVVSAEQQPNPPAPADDKEPQRRDIVKYSDGKELVGELFLRGETTLTLFDLERKNHRKVSLRDIARIEVEVESATMEKVWRFKEEGSPEKIYTGEQYPLHKYLTHLTLRNGVKISCHLAAVIWLKTEKEQQRIFLLKKQAGSVVQNLEDLVYVKSIEFFDRRLVKGGGKLTVRVKDKTPSAAVAIQWKQNQCFCADVIKNSCVWADLPPDIYDIVLVADGKIYYMLSDISANGNDDSEDGLESLEEKKLDGEEDESGKLTDELRKEIVNYIAGADEFFEVKEALDIGGNSEMVRSVVRQKRVNETSYGTDKKNITLWRFDIWFLHRIQEEWKIESRAFLWRAYLPEGDTSGVPKLAKTEKFGGIDLTNSRKPVVIELTDDGEREN
ncbi:MAG: hypothetical protein U5N86_11765 [Planctomycetota bacterium]|nr:hypothetical protein [Planctomycetota bacterium]